MSPPPQKKKKKKEKKKKKNNIYIYSKYHRGVPPIPPQIIDVSAPQPMQVSAPIEGQGQLHLPHPSPHHPPTHPPTK